jgi:hypothetical protein
MSELPLDPSEYPGTPEYEELFKERQARRHMLLDLIEEQATYDKLQFPYRFSNL